METQPQLQVTGYRGIWGKSLTPEIVKKFTNAFGQFTKEDVKKSASWRTTILIGRDGRESGKEITQIIIEELKKINITAIDGDILPTPTIIFTVKKHNYDGAVIITASHNPTEYNGLKFVTKEALLTNEAQVEKIKKYIEQNVSQRNIPSKTAHNFLLKICYARLASLRNAFRRNISLRDAHNFPKEHADAIIAHVNVEAIRNRKFKVAADMINASACVIDPYLFEQFNAELIPLNNIPNGQFAHRPEPAVENLEDIGQLVKEVGADIGFAHDPDADRVVIVDENGKVISEDYTLAFGVENILSKNPGENVVMNLSSSSMVSDIVEKYNGKCFRTKVGEANVLEGIQKYGAMIGGEGTSGVIYPAINTSRDGFVSLSLALELLAERNQTVSECVATLPKYFIKRDKWPVSGKNLNEIYEKLKIHFKDAQINEIDGLRLDFDDKSWIHLRPSITEPIIRLFGEAKTEDRVNAIFNEAKLTLGSE